LLPIFYVKGLLIIDALTFLVSALLLVRLPNLLPATPHPQAKTSFVTEAREGLTYIWDKPALRAICLGFCALVAVTAVDDVALVFLAKGPLESGDVGAGLLYAGSGAGLLLGFLVLARFGHQFSPSVLMIAGYVLSSSGNLFTGLSWAIPVAFSMQAVRGIGLSLQDVGRDTLIQRLVPRGMLGRVFGNLFGGIGLAAALSYVIGGFLLDMTDARIVLVAAGTAGLIVAVFTSLMLAFALRSVDDSSLAV
jgi:MFS family permease